MVTFQLQMALEHECFDFCWFIIFNAVSVKKHGLDILSTLILHYSVDLSFFNNEKEEDFCKSGRFSRLENWKRSIFVSKPSFTKSVMLHQHNSLYFPIFWMKDVQLKIDFGGLSQNLTAFSIFFQVGNRRSARN